MIRDAVTHPSDGIGTVAWATVKELTRVKDWTTFAKGRLGGLNRALRNVEGVKGNAVLLWEGEGWVEDGAGDYSAGTLAIDGPAVKALRTVMNLE